MASTSRAAGGGGACPPPSPLSLQLWDLGSGSHTGAAPWLHLGLRALLPAAAELKPLLSFVSVKVREESPPFKCQEEAFHPLVQEDFEQ